jgi:hypothetical protein
MSNAIFELLFTACGRPQCFVASAGRAARRADLGRHRLQSVIAVANGGAHRNPSPACDVARQRRPPSPSIVGGCGDTDAKPAAPSR